MLQRIYSDYKRHTKPINQEEPLDFFIFRPIAYIVVKLTNFLNITPNQFSFLALLMGLYASFNIFSLGMQGYTQAFLGIIGFSIFDCCDGMVARIKKNGHPYGEFIDMAVDVISSCCIFASLLYISQEKWMLFLSLISLLIHVSIYNYLKEHQSGRSYNRTHVSKIHQLFYRCQFVLDKYKDNQSLIMWGLVAGSTHLSVLAIALFVNKLEIYYFYSIIFANGWSYYLLRAQSRASEELQG